MDSTLIRTQAELDKLFLDLALMIAAKGTCDRARVGAIVAIDSNFLSAGVNTSAKGLPTCDDEGHLLVGGHCCRTVHAEANAIYNTQDLRDLKKATMYITHEPCIHCRKLIVQFGIKRVVYYYKYRSTAESEQISGDVEWIHYNGLQESI